MKSVPVARGLILCEGVQYDATTGNLTIMNCFTKLSSPSFPASNSPFSVVAFLSDGFGDLYVRVEIMQLDTGQLVYFRDHDLAMPNRLYEVRYRLQVSRCVFPEPGVYEVQLTIEGEIVADTRILILESEK